MATVVGVDGCKVGWFYFCLSRRDNQSLSFGIAEDFRGLIEALPNDSRVFLDIPIGLVDHGEAGRGCDAEARRALGSPRASSVFSAPAFPVLAAKSFSEAKQISSRAVGRMISKQAFALVPKIREVNEYLAAPHGSNVKVREVHPEVCFWGLNNKKPMNYPKRTPAGYAERIDVLKRFGNVDAIVKEPLEKYRRKEVSRDDILDALVALVVGCTSSDRLQTMPSTPPMDARGLPMEMVFTVKPNEDALTCSSN